MPASPNTNLRRIAPACALACLIAIMWSSAVLAHAVIVRSEPPDGATVERAPREIRLWFSEPIDPRVTRAHVLNVQGAALLGTEARVDARDPTLLVISTPDLPDGIYNVVYSTLSAADGHATRGHLVFRVGAAAAGESVPFGASPTQVAPWEIILRWLNFGSLVGLAGAVGVALLVLAPDRRRARDDQGVASALERARVRVLYWAMACALGGLAIGLALLYMQAVILTLPSAGEENPVANALRLVFGTSVGGMWVTRQATLALVLLMLFLWSRSGSQRAAGLATALLCIALLGIQTLSGHAAAVASLKLMALLADFLHLTAASLWVGGLMALAVGLLPLALARRGTLAFSVLTQAGWGSFGGLAALSVGALIATGLYSAGQQIASLDGLLTTSYGRTLVVKVGLVALVGLFGLLNSAALHPRLAAPLARLLHRPDGWSPSSLRRLPALITAELIVGLTVLLASAVLTSLPPPNGPEYAPQPTSAIPEVLSARADDLLVTLEVKPNQPGDNIALVRVANTRRPAPAPVLRVILRFTYQGEEAGTTSANAQQIAADTYQLAGPQLSLSGRWRVDVVVRRKGLEDSVARFDWVVSAGGPSRPVVYSDRPIGAPLTLAAAIVMAGIVVALVAALRRSAGLAHR